MMQLHQNAAMRTTIDFPEDLHRIVASLSVHTQRSLSQTAADLMRRGLAMPPQQPNSTNPLLSVHAATGLPVLHSRRTITPEDIKALDEEF
jgi:hypothetical protein